MKARNIVLPAAILLAIATLLPVHALAETLSWNAVTTFTDGSSIGTTPVTYTAVWSTNSSLASPVTLASSIPTSSAAFSIQTAGMPRGTTIYFGVRSTVNGVNSAYSAALPWSVPTIAPTTHPPASPSNLRLQ